MSKYLVDSSEMEAIATAIRLKEGSQSTMTVDEMPTRIQNIPSGGGTDYMVQRIQGTLSSYTIPYSCTKISEYAFADQPITSITIPHSITTIYQGAFFESMLTSVTFEESTVVNLYSGIFEECHYLRTLNNFSVNILPTAGGRKTIPLSCFRHTALEGEVYLGDSVTVEPYAFINDWSNGLLYLILTQTDTSILNTCYTFYSAGAPSFNLDHCRLIVPSSPDHSILNAYKNAFSYYSSIMIEA